MGYVPDDIKDVLQTVLFSRDIYEFFELTVDMQEIEKELGMIPVFEDVKIKASGHFLKETPNTREFVKIYTDGSTLDSYSAPVGGGGALVLGDNNRVVGAFMIEMSSPEMSLSSSHVEAISSLVSLALVRRQPHAGIEELLTDSQAVQHHILNTNPSLLQEETISWCRGHSGNMANEFADRIAKSSRQLADENYAWDRTTEKQKRPQVQLVTPGEFLLPEAKFSDNISSDYLRSDIRRIEQVSDIYICSELQKWGRLAFVATKMIGNKVATVHRHVFPQISVADIASFAAEFSEKVLENAPPSANIHLSEGLYNAWEDASLTEEEHHLAFAEVLEQNGFTPSLQQVFQEGDTSHLSGLRSKRVIGGLDKIFTHARQHQVPSNSLPLVGLKGDLLKPVSHPRVNFSL